MFETHIFSHSLVQLCVAFSVKAQVLIDVSKLNCHQFATYKVASPDKIAIWLNGYFHGKRGELNIDTQELEGDADKIQEYCIKNPDALLMQAVEVIFGSRK